MNPETVNRISLAQGDITQLEVDAIVNAANTSLLGGGGVDGAIHREAGAELLAECRTLEGCETGSAKITKGYKLKAKHVIHAVGPVYRDGNSGEAELLAGCYRTSLKLAAQNQCRSIAFPAISCGAYRYPLAEAANIAFSETINFLNLHSRIEQVIFALYDEKAYSVYQQIWQELCKAGAE
ncbi:MAG: O-acetyl-ADP-ribose deacetylase [Planctomycetota bacterium]|nr:MAG: O-acetyl-ADP-ribose deacetylase [Planctomycetota bacterium]